MRASINLPALGILTLIVVVGVVALFSWAQSSPNIAEASAETMSLGVGDVNKDPLGGCTGDPLKPDKCSVGVDTPFTIIVRADAIPAGGLAAAAVEVTGICDNVGSTFTESCPANTLLYVEDTCANEVQVGILFETGGLVLLGAPATCTHAIGAAGQPQVAVGGSSVSPFAKLGIVNDPGATGVFKPAAPLDLFAGSSGPRNLRAKNCEEFRRQYFCFTTRGRPVPPKGARMPGQGFLDTKRRGTGAIRSR